MINYTSVSSRVRGAQKINDTHGSFREAGALTVMKNMLSRRSKSASWLGVQKVAS